MDDGCIEAVGSTTEKGYKLKSIYIGGRSFNLRQHRMAWELKHGPIPEGLMVLHHCDNPCCVNLEHLYLGSHEDNMRDRKSRNRGANRNTNKTHCKQGHEFTPANTFITREGWRVCKTCRSLRVRRR